MKAAKYPQVDPNLPSAPPLGGINLGVSAYSETPGPRLRGDPVPDQAREPDRDRGRRRPAAGARGPLRLARHQEGLPGFADLIKQSIEDAAARPSESPAYQDISLAIQEAIHPTTDIDPNDPGATYDELRDLLEQAINREGLL